MLQMCLLRNQRVFNFLVCLQAQYMFSGRLLLFAYTIAPWRLIFRAGRFEARPRLKEAGF